MELSGKSFAAFLLPRLSVARGPAALQPPGCVGLGAWAFVGPREPAALRVGRESFCLSPLHSHCLAELPPVSVSLGQMTLICCGRTTVFMAGSSRTHLAVTL